MRTVKLDDPLTVEGAQIATVTVHDPNDIVRRKMVRARSGVVGFTYFHTIIFASMLTALGQVALRGLSARDHAKVERAIEEAFQSAQGRHAEWKEGADA